MEGKVPVIPTEIFLQENAEEFSCCICTNIAFPIVQTTCGHVFCDHCIMQALSIKNECPTCRTPNPNPQENLFIKRFINNLKVKCLNFRRGCTYEGTFSDMLNEHVNKNCLFQPIPCPFAKEGCTIQLTKKEMDEHITTCEFRQITCKFCSKVYNFKFEKEHLNICPEMLIPCPNNCQMQIKRNEVQKHMELCPEKFTSCVVTGCHHKIKMKDLNSHLTENLLQHTMLMNNQLLQIKCENEQMKKQIDILNDKVTFLEKEMDRIRNEGEMKKSIGELVENFKQTNLNPPDLNPPTSNPPPPITTTPISNPPISPSILIPPIPNAPIPNAPIPNAPIPNAPIPNAPIPNLEPLVHSPILDPPKQIIEHHQPYTNIFEPKCDCFEISNNGLLIKKISGNNSWDDSQVFLKEVPPHGQFYMEVKIESIHKDKTGMVIGITKSKLNSHYQSDIGIGMKGYKYGIVGKETIIGNNGDRIGILLDFESKIMRFFWNGFPTDNIANLQPNTVYFPVIHIYYIEDSVSVSFPDLKESKLDRLLMMNQFNNDILESSINGSLIAFNDREQKFEPNNKKNFQISRYTIKKIKGGDTWSNAPIFLGKAINTSNFGKVFWEITIDSINDDKTGFVIGITKDKNDSYYNKDMAVGMGGDAYNLIGNKLSGNRGDTIGIMVDQMEKIIKFYKNGIDMNIIGSLQDGCIYYPVIHLYYVGDQFTVKFPNYMQANEGISKLGGIPFTDYEKVIRPLAPVFSLTNNNLTIKKISGGNQWTDAPVFIEKRLNYQRGKVYWEVFINSINADTTGMVIGITPDKNSSFYQRDIAIGMKGYKYGGVTGDYDFTAQNGDRIGVLVDFDDSVIRFYRNGEYTNLSGKIIKGVDYYPVIHIYYINDQVTVYYPNMVKAIQSIRGPFYISTEYEKQFDPKYSQFFRISQNTIEKIGGNNSWEDAPVFLSKKLNYNSGRVYWEVIINSINQDRTGMVIGITSNKEKSYYNKDIGIGMKGYKYGVVGDDNLTVQNGDRIGVLVDFDNSIIRFYKNGVSTSFIGSISKNKEYWPVVHLYYVKDKVTVNLT